MHNYFDNYDLTAVVITHVANVLLTNVIARYSKQFKANNFLN